MQAVETQNLTKVYQSKFGKQKVTAVSELTLNVDSGSLFGLLGPNGAGKTTLVKVLLGIARASAGEGKILGENMRNHKIREKIGYLPENHRYPNYLTGEQVLKYFGKFSERDNQVLNDRVDNLIEIVKLGKWKKNKTKYYSKGMMQRLGLAHSLLNDPDLLFLDEPADGVDPIGRKEIRDLLLQLKERGKTIFLNSHLLSEVEMVCDRVAIMDRGSIIREGTVKELTEQSKVYRIMIDGKIEQMPIIPEDIYVKFTKQEEQHFEILAENTEDLNKFIDVLRGNNILIKSIVPKKDSLEDIFISLINEKKGGLE